MINNCYGGFGLSNAAMDEYHKRCPEKQEVDYFDLDRHDPVMIQIVKEMGTKANRSCSEIELKKIPVQYLQHYSIEEYDGLERVVIHYNTYKIDAAKAILLDQSLSKSDKLTRISAILNADLKALS